MYQLYVNGHLVEFRGNQLIVDYKVMDVQLKPSKLGFFSVIKVHNNKIKAGKNKIVFNVGNIIVNGEQVGYDQVKSNDKKSPDEQLNKNEGKNLSSTAEKDKTEMANGKIASHDSTRKSKDDGSLKR